MGFLIFLIFVGAMIFLALGHWPVTLIAVASGITILILQKRSAAKRVIWTRQAQAKLEHIKEMTRRKERATEREQDLARLAAERDREIARIAAERDREFARMAARRAAALSKISRLVFDAQTHATQLSLILSRVELSLDRAEAEFTGGSHSPFWEAMEDAVRFMREFDRTIAAINEAKRLHTEQSKPFGDEAPAFSLGVRVLPDPTSTAQRMKDLYRTAQKNSGYAIVYEQRRTNATLTKGFRSFGDALTSLGDVLTSEMERLGLTLGIGLEGIEAALQESAKQLSQQHTELLASARDWHEEASAARYEQIALAERNAEQSEKDAEERQEFHTSALEMIEKLQRRRSS